MNYSMIIAVPSLIIWGFGIPAFCMDSIVEKQREP